MRPQVALQLEPTGAPTPRFVPARCRASIELYWLPRCGRLVRAPQRAHLGGRPRPAGAAAAAGPVPLRAGGPGAGGAVRGRELLADPRRRRPFARRAREGPVGSRRLGRWRVFRYEVRRWRDGVIADADEAVGRPQRLSDDPRLARRLLALVAELPSPAWGRDELVTGEMWNSNSVIAWLLARSGLPADAIRPPAGGRAPGWAAGLVVAHREQGGAATGGPGRSFGGTRMVARPATLRGVMPPPRRCQPAPDPHGGAAPDPAPVRLARAEDSVRAGAADLGHRPPHPDPRRAASHLVELTEPRPVMPTQR
jgi:hypothetical protein